MKPTFIGNWLVRIIALLALCLLTGCASKLAANVTSFQQWPANVDGQTYRIEPPPNEKNALEHQTYADMVRAAISKTGLVEAQGKDKARFAVSFQYENPVRQTWVEQAYDPYFNGPFMPFGSVGFFRGGWGWGGGVYMAPTYVNTPVDVYENTLTLSIHDNASQTQVFRSTARALTREAKLPAVMPYLVRAIFDGFPGNNGQAREVEYEWK
jgi:hypothetical protein